MKEAEKHQAMVLAESMVLRLLGAKRYGLLMQKSQRGLPCLAFGKA